jgi:hypothetical protein
MGEREYFRTKLVYPDSRYNMWRRAVFDTLPTQRDFPLLMSLELLSLIDDEHFCE